ncbi:MAG TPA: DEAD/DEAH box helicase [Phycisphaerae bacterium]|nr:DEAD/DEAH box helicase [Phycisphaerae bacterium]HRY67493.1 DEAD/DEAH box helicase [Phycisphaerae bacterium]HSA27914.1 DEAD/DEAH box helicase [Phycisphaerae bacterium]
MTFEQFGLAEPILRAVRAEGYTTPTPIQVKAIPPAIEGRDVLGCAQTGTGKTAAFALPILHRLGGPGPRDGRHGRVIRALVVAPTRELAAQIGDSLRSYGRHMAVRSTVIFGGVNQNPQARALRDGIDILVGTPGRLLDLMQQGLVDLRHVEVLVLDEADHMLDMGFIPDIRRILAKVPVRRQTLLFSATMPEDIRTLANAILRQPIHVEVAVSSLAAETVEQAVYFVDKRSKPAMLESYLNGNAVTRALVFTRTKHGADRVARHLARAGIRAEAIHGNKSQGARTRVINQFKSQAPPVLVATDIAARGLDIDEVSHVINYDVPNVPETYVHRIGRTGRAGATGLAVSFCDHEEMAYLRDIERLIRRSIPVSLNRAGVSAIQARHAAGGHRQHMPAASGLKSGSGRDHGLHKAGAGAQPATGPQACPLIAASHERPQALPAAATNRLSGWSRPSRRGLRRGR